jgi:putative solute:sodium symporter small subunit
MYAAMENNHDSRRAYWRANTALIRNLLLIWALVSLVFSILLVQPLNLLQLGRVPFGFWMAQQGSIYVFVALIFVYATQMDRLDRKYNRGVISNPLTHDTVSTPNRLPSDSNPPEA